MPRSTRCLWMCFFDTVLIMHRPTNGKPGFFSSLVFRPRDAADINVRKIQKKTSITCMKKGKRKKPDFPLVCTCGSNTTLKFQIEILEIERVIAEMPFFFSFFSCRSIHLTYLWNRVWYYLSIGDELGIETCIDLLLVFSSLSPPNLTLIGNDDFDTNLVWKSWCF